MYLRKIIELLSVSKYIASVYSQQYLIILSLISDGQKLTKKLQNFTLTIFS